MPLSLSLSACACLLTSASSESTYSATARFCFCASVQSTSQADFLFVALNTRGRSWPPLGDWAGRRQLLSQSRDQVGFDYEIVLINDGSKDASWAEI
jgi:hypothetical protein